jgi:hypothetical protein
VKACRRYALKKIPRDDRSRRRPAAESVGIFGRRLATFSGAVQPLHAP